MARHWDKQSTTFLSKNYGVMRAVDIGQVVDRTEKAVHEKAYRMGYRAMPLKKSWTHDEIELALSHQKVAGRTSAACRCKRSLELKKRKEEDSV